MEETFTLPIHYKGRETSFEFTFRKLGYTYKIFATIDGHPMQFEPDEEGSFRATLADLQGDRANPTTTRNPDRGLIEAIIQRLTLEFK